jgi:hypothetical protein
MSFLKRKVTFVVAAVAVVALAGGAYAATQSAGPTSRQAFLNDVAKRLNIKPAQLTSALQGAFADRLNALVAAGRLTQAQANAIEQRVKKTGAVPLGGFGPGMGAYGGRGAAPGFAPNFRPGFAPNVRPGLAPKFRPGFAPNLRPGFGSGSAAPLGLMPFGLLFAFGPAARAGGVSAVTGYLGVTRKQLLSDLASGKSLAQIATAHGKTVSGLEGVITDQLRTRLDKAVANKHLTGAQEQKLLSSMTKALDAIITRPLPKLPMALPFRGALRMHRGWFVPPVPGAARKTSHGASFAPAYGTGWSPAAPAAAPAPAVAG